ncbi:ATP-binding cassette domain-containing protein [Lactobacillus sp. ESL0791]|uniref:ABC transporter ATP-binding protein n=1 Tax=Lactobacillus sp. ESL0791 TaxID=2983234 RepID=UPI002473A75E
MISVNNLTKKRGSATILQNLSFQVKSGRVTGFLGPNGAGKSSTIRILLGLDQATSGNALINGIPYIKLKNPLYTVGAVLDGSGAHPARTGRNHLKWIAQAAGISTSRVDEVLEIVGLTQAASKRVKQYSLGMSRRLALGAALLGDPDILILDEPTNGLDPEGIRWLRNFLHKRAQSGKTVLLSSHLMGETAETVDDVIIINHGQIIANGTLREVIGAHSCLEDAFFTLIKHDGGKQ